MKKSRRLARHESEQPTASTRQPTTPTPASQNGTMLHWQRQIGNQAVQRHLDQLPGMIPDTVQRTPSNQISRSTEQGTLQRDWDSDQLDSRIEPTSVGDTSGGCTVKKRTVDYITAPQPERGSYGSTASKLVVEYAVDDTGNITLGSLRPEFTVTIYTPFITSDDFVEAFTPLMEKFWDTYEGDMAKFSEDHDVGNFNYYDQTLRHEEKHVSARNLAVIDLVPQFKQFMKDSGALTKGEENFKERASYFWKSGWDEMTEAKITHKRIHELDARNMVDEYQRRVGTEKPKPKPTIIDSVMDFFGF